MSIDIANIRFSYPDSSDANIVDIPSWHVDEHQHILVNGPSGCGKSTLLNLICGMLVPLEGEIKVLGNRIDRMATHQRDRFRAEHIGYVFQQFNLVPYLNAIENINLASYFSRKKLKNVASEITALLSELNIPKSSWQTPCANLSIGQQQRIAIARALINRPEILIADEPTSSLDAQNRDNFMSVLISILEEQPTTLVMVSHDAHLAQFFDSVLTFDELNMVRN